VAERISRAKAEPVEARDDEANAISKGSFDAPPPAESSPRATRASRLRDDPPVSAPERDLAGALHEVSNALTVVLGWIEQARESNPTEVLPALDIAAARARHARTIVRRAIGAEVPPEESAAVAVLVRDAVKGLEPEAKRLGIGLETAIDPRCADVLLESGSSVLQILTNLLLNALSMSPAGAPVRVDARLSGEGEVVIGVSDDGPGVAPDRRATLFEAGVTTRAGGAGIGLRHAAALARKGGGSLSLVKADGGARFELTWPRAPEVSGRRASLPPSLRVPLSGIRVLLVEDDEAVVDLLDTALSARGATVVSARSSAAMREALSTGSFDAALVDISPIRDDVVGALDAVRGSSPAVRVFVISGSASNGPSLPEGYPAVWIRKPFEVREIVDALAAPIR
jgi:CheY-like chemotaxis protein